MKALLTTRCGCTKMLDVPDGIPTVAVAIGRRFPPYDGEENYMTIGRYEKREFRYEDTGEMHGVKIAFYREIA